MSNKIKCMKAKKGLDDYKIAVLYTLDSLTRLKEGGLIVCDELPPITSKGRKLLDGLYAVDYLPPQDVCISASLHARNEFNVLTVKNPLLDNMKAN